MDALDGSAIAGLLVDVFDAEMTTASGVCANCDTRQGLADLLVYTQAPGTVARCPTCHSVLMVFAEIRGITCVDLGGFAALEPARGETGH